MFLSQLKLLNFKNYNSARLEFDQKVNIVYGDNGSGKTNLLDAIYFLSMSKSYFSLSDKYLITDDEPHYRIDGQFNFDDKKSEILAIKYKRSQKKELSINNKKLAKVNELIGRYPVVMVAPDDINIVKGGSKDRRDYVNRLLCQCDPKYLNDLMTYNRLMRQKDALLKGHVRPNRYSVEVYNDKLIPLAINLHVTIKKRIKDLQTVVYEQYGIISNQKDMITINYLSDLSEQDPKYLFDSHIDKEINFKRPLVGIQRDDYEFLIKSAPLKKFGSQGQIKSFLYSLKLAEFSILKQSLEKTPILILDDFFEKLDGKRLSALLALVNQPDFGQVFLSDTELKRSEEIFDKRGIKFASFHVTNGQVEKKID